MEVPKHALQHTYTNKFQSVDMLKAFYQVCDLNLVYGTRTQMISFTGLKSAPSITDVVRRKKEINTCDACDEHSPCASTTIQL